MRPDSYGKRFRKIIYYHNKIFDEKQKKLKKNKKEKIKKMPYAPDSLPKTLKIQESKIPDMTFHALRHYHATVLYRQKVPDKNTQQIG
jgi:integrase